MANRPTSWIIRHFKTAVFCAVSAAVLAGQAFAAEEVHFVRSVEQQLKNPVDVAVDLNGRMFVLDRAQDQVFVYNAEGTKEFSFGQSGSKPGELRHPESIIMTPDGNVVIGDNGNNRVQVFNPKGEFLYVLGQPGSKSGQFRDLSCVAVDNFGFLYIGDAYKQTVTRYSPGGVYLREIPVPGKPYDLVFDLQQNAYVLMPERGAVVKFSPDWEKEKEFNLVLNQHNFIASTLSLDVDDRGDIYIIENNTNSVKKLGQDRNLIFSFGSRGNGRGQFDDAQAITADKNGNIYIADGRNGRVQVLKITGSTKNRLAMAERVYPTLDFRETVAGEEAIVDLAYAPEKGLFGISDKGDYVFSRLSAEPLIRASNPLAAKLSRPQGVYVTEEGRILIADTGNNQLQFLKPDGKYEYHFGERGEEHGHFNGLQSIAVDREGYIYVADTQNHRIQKFNKDGIYLKIFGQANSKRGDSQLGALNFPTDLVFDSSERLFVLDSRNKRVQVFSRDGNFIKAIGGKSDAHIQFVEPVDIAINEDDYLFVADKGDFSVKIINPEGKLFQTFGSAGQGAAYFPRLSAVEASGDQVYVADYSSNQIQVFHFNPDGIGSTRVAKQNLPVKIKSETSPSPSVTREEKPVARAVPPPAEPLDVAQNKQPPLPPAAEPPALAKAAKPDALKPPAVQPPAAVIPKAKDISPDTKYLYVTKFSYPLYGPGKSEEEAYAAARAVILESAQKELADQLKVPVQILDNVLNVESEEILKSGMLKITISVPTAETYRNSGGEVLFVH